MATAKTLIVEKAKFNAHLTMRWVNVVVVIPRRESVPVHHAEGGRGRRLGTLDSVDNHCWQCLPWRINQSNANTDT